jgi:cellulose synthase/poly-beta-1,6-N-acetylglucosamine synthase-like glycosyltransferase
MKVDRAAEILEGEGRTKAPDKNNAPDLHAILQRYFQLDMETLADAIALARVEKVTLDAFLLSRGLIGEVELYRGIAQALHVPFVNRPFRLTQGYPFELLLSSGVARFEDGTGETAVIAAPRGHFFEDLMLRAFTGDKVPPIILTTPSNFRRAILTQFGRAQADQEVHRLGHAFPEFSAERLRLRSFLGLMIILPALLALGLTVKSDFWTAGLYLLSALFVAPSLLFKSIVTTFKPDIPTNELLGDADLPDYTILLPLHREADIVPRLLDHMLKIDYPRPKLQIILLVEEKDDTTRDAIASSSNFSHFETIICPEGLPKTKPRALAIGQAYARGELIVVFDAEDMPDPLQLRRAATAFAQASPQVGCVQASLAIYNRHDSWLSRMFSYEYAVLFDVMLPGMSRLHMPIPLGGTSNHLRRSALLAVQGWDPWNVTEDADLGLRLSRFGYETQWLPSTTFEEAPNDLKIWFHQRTRWFKGWMQTSIIHLGRARRAGIKLRLIDHMLIMLVATTSFVTSLYHPILVIAVTECVQVSERGLQGLMVHRSILSAISTLLIIHLILNYVMLRRAACYRSYRLTFRDYILQAPYSLLKTAAAWFAFIELIIAPSHWRKTPHGRARSFYIQKERA